MRRFPHRRSNRLAALALALALPLLATASATANWPTYHADPARSGVDQSTGAALPFATGWKSADLGADVYGEPLVQGGVVYVATENNDVYALNEATGQPIWHQNAGTPVPSSKLPCGDIGPNVGITSTPVIDPARNMIYLVADTWDGTNAHHILMAYRASDGAPAFAQNVDPAAPSTYNAKNQLQRPGLAISGGQVLIGFGGNDGDCGTYWGYLVSASESGPATPQVWKAPVGNGAAIWQGGGAPAVDAAGSVYAATGNTTGTASSTYDYSDSVIRFTPQAALQDSFAPASWAADDNSDSDLGSAAPQLLGGGLLFQAGKNGNGYLVRSGAMGGVNGQAYQASACNSFGADAYGGGTLYVSCTSGVRAYSLNLSAPSFTLLWHGPSDANGPPILAAGLVWVTAFNNSKLYGLDPATGAIRVQQATPSMVHFVTPSASDGRLFLATGHTVEQYTIGVATNPGTAPPTPAPAPTPTKNPAVCTRLTIAIRHPHHVRVTRADVFAGRRRIGHFKARRNLRSVHVRARTGTYTLRLVEHTNRNRRLVYRLRFKGCKRIR